MKMALNRSKHYLAAFASTLAFPLGASAACTKPDAQTLQKLESLGIVQLCQPIHAEIKKSLIELPTEIITSALPFPLNHAVVWFPKAGVITFKIPPTAEYKDYAICGYSRDGLSEIPKPGEYLKHGWEKLKAQSIDYGWVLKRRGIGKGRTSLNVNVYFSFLPASKLEQARTEGVCMKNLTPGRWR